MYANVRLQHCLVLLLVGFLMTLVGCGANPDAAPEARQEQPENVAPTGETAGEQLAPEDIDSKVRADLKAPSAGSESGRQLPRESFARETRESRAETDVEGVGPELAAPTGELQIDKRAGKMPRIARSMVQPPDAMKTPSRSVPRLHPSAPTLARDMEPRGKSTGAPRRAPTKKTGETLDHATSQAPPGSAFELVEVFYATDRRVESPAEAVALSQLDMLPAVAGIGVTLLFLALGLARRVRRLFWSLAVLTSLVTVAWAGVWFYGQWPERMHPLQKGIHYGDQRGPLQVGTCLVSIPKSHEIGEVESPSILRLEVREDVRKHIVLQHTEAKPESAFFAELQQRVRRAEQPEVFVFVHGYNVTFADAARRTAQIAYDVKFSGAPIFFSWPSQGGLLQYTVDETNVAWAVPHLKQFLLDVVKKSGAKSVNLIAHSMGSRALTQALRELALELKENSTLFNQVILAAPDIDAEIFRRDLAPALVQTSRHVTLYASSNDEALAASKHVHGYPRAGESGNGIVVLPGVDTIDVSQVDDTILGHSYYGSSNPILRDIYFLIHDALPAARRRWLHPASYNGLTYWIFQQARRTAARSTP